MTESGQEILKSRVILFRSGGLGDILLTLPLLETLSQDPGPSSTGPGPRAQEH